MVPRPGGGGGGGKGASAVVVDLAGIGGPPGGGGGGRSPSPPSSSSSLSSIGPGTTAVARLAASRPTTAASEEILGRTIELGGIVGAFGAFGGGTAGGGGIATASAVPPRPVGPAPPPTAGIATPYLACILASTSHCDSPLFTPLTSIAGGMYPALPGAAMWVLSSCTKDRLHDKSRPSTVVWSRASMHRVAAAADAKDANANPRGRPSSGFSGTLRLS